MTPTKISKTLQKISTEPILKRRQHLLYSLIKSDNTDTVVKLISLSLSLKTKVDIMMRNNISDKDTNYSSFFGEQLHYYLSNDFKKLRTSVRTYPKEWQLLAQWVFGDKFKSSVRLDFLYEVMPKVYSLEELTSSFITIPEFIDNTRSVVMHDNVEEIKVPFKFFKINSQVRAKCDIKYYYQVSGVVETNITSRVVKEYIANSLTGRSKFGAIFAISLSKNRKSPHHIQPLIMSEDVETLKAIYKGKGVDNFSEKVYFFTEKTFKNTSKFVKVHYNRPETLTSIHDIALVPAGVKKNNILIHDGGITKLDIVRDILYMKVVDYLLNEDYEPIGLKLKDGDIHIELLTNISDSFVEKGIDNTYIKVAKYSFKDEELTTEFISVLNSNYGECPMCGVVASLKKSGVCWRCNGKLFRIAVENGDKLEFLYNDNVHEVGFTTFVYKYEVEFTEFGLNYKECEWCWQGKQQYLPYDWWA